MTRRHWQLATLLSISFLAVGGAVFEFAQLMAAGGSKLPLMAWIILFLAALVPMVIWFAGSTGDAGQEIGVDEFADAMPIGVALFGSDGCLRYCNEVFQQFFPDSSVRAEFSAITAAISGDSGQPAEFDGDHEMADGRWLRLARHELSSGAFVLTALDISRVAALEADFRTAGKQFRRFLSVTADWIWETDDQHRFVMARAVGTEPDNKDFGWLKGSSPFELTPAGEALDRLAVERCMLDMGRHRRLDGISLTLDAGDRTVRVHLKGMPRHDDNGSFVGYRGVGIWEHPAAPEDAKKSRVPPAQVGATSKLLLVDDSSTNRRLGVSILRNIGYEADAVPDGQQAVEAVRDGNYTAVLMDIWMPEMDGFEATAAIRALPEPRRNIPVIAMTAHDGPEERERCLAAGMDEHVGKPIDRDLLATILRQLAGPPTGRNIPVEIEGAPSESSDGQPSTGLVNSDVLNQLSNDAGPALVNELIAAFMAETDERLVRIADAIKAGNHEEIAADAHSMKSSSGTFGALPLQALSVILEAAATKGDVAALAATHDNLSALTSRTWREYAARGYRRE